MTEEQKEQEQAKEEQTAAQGAEEEKSEPDEAVASAISDAVGEKQRGGGRGGRGDKGGRRRRRDEKPAEESEWKERVIQIRRVTKVVKGGKKLSFRAVVVVGNQKGEVGLGLGKSNEVIGAIQKGVADAKKSLIKVPIHHATIPHAINSRAGGSRMTLRPASKGTGVIAGGAARAVIELAGVENILSKSLGSNSPLNVARATLKGLSELRTFQTIAQRRGKTVQEILN